RCRFFIDRNKVALVCEHDGGPFMNRRATCHRVAASVVVALCVGALPAMVSAANLCFTLADGSTVVLGNFKVKKGGASAWGGRKLGPGPHGITFVSSLSGEDIATLDGQHIAMDLTEGGASFARGTDGKLAGGGTTFYRTFHSVRLDAGSDGKIGDGGTGYDE